jgi:putative ATP-binding cassette transporter
MIQIIPALIVAPMFIQGHAQFGVITQSAMAFSQLLGAFSLIVTQFQSISSFTAVVARLGSFADAIEQAQSVGVSSMTCEHRTGPDCAICLPDLAPVDASMAIKVREDDEGVIYECLTLRSITDGKVLLNDLTVTIDAGTRVLITGPNHAAKAALFRVTAGIWDVGGGWVVRPSPRNLMFLPERPYLPHGTMRSILTVPGCGDFDKERLKMTIAAFNLEAILSRAGGLDTPQNWDLLLSLGEQQLLAYARMFQAAPRFAFLDRPATTLSDEEVEHTLQKLTESSITYLTIGELEGLYHLHDAILEVAADASWRWEQVNRPLGKVSM